MTDQTQTILGNIPVALHVKKYRLTSSECKGEFQKRLIFIGSHPDCDFCLQEPSISRHHAKIELDQTGYRLVDLGSKNGTFIGDIRVNDIYLTSPISFRCGGAEIKFELCSNDSIEVAISNQDHFGGLIGQSIAMREIFGLLEKVSATPATVLVEGESGCGK